MSPSRPAQEVVVWYDPAGLRADLAARLFPSEGPRPMSALPPIADIALHRSECPLCAKSGLSCSAAKFRLFDHLVSAHQKRFRNFQPERLGSPEIDDQQSGARSLRHRDAIISLAARYKLPAVYSARDYASAGGLLSYGPDQIGH